MRSLKKTFWAGFIFLIAICLIYNLFLLLYNFLRPLLKPLRELLFLTTKHRIPGLEFVAFIVVVLIFGLIAQFLSRRAPSKIPVINRIFKFTKIIHETAHKLNTGEIKTTKVKYTDLYALGFTTGKSEKINEEEIIPILLPSTPNPTTGYTFVTPPEKVVYLPKRLNKWVLKMILTAGLFK